MRNFLGSPWIKENSTLTLETPSWPDCIPAEVPRANIFSWLMSIWSISPVTGFSSDRFAQVTAGKWASTATAHIAPPAVLAFSAAPEKLSDLMKSKFRTHWHGFRHTTLFPYEIWQREKPYDVIFPPLHHISSSLEKLVFFHMTNGSLPVNFLKFWLLFPLTGVPLGKIRKASCSFCVMMLQWDTTAPPVRPTASSAALHWSLTHSRAAGHHG